MKGHAELRGDRLLVVRHLVAPPSLVWEVLTSPEHLAAFWGGDHAAIPPESVIVDLRVGGRFELETRSLDGAPGRRLSFTYDAIEEPTLLVFTEPETRLVTEIRLEPDVGGTTLRILQRRLPPELRTEQARSGLAAIAAQLERLTTDLAGQRQEER